MDNKNNEIAVKVSNVKKMYRLGQIGGGTLQADLQSWWARLRHKEDPNTKIDDNSRLYGQTFMALNGIDLTIYKGEAVGIIGRNGAGKSTLLKLLSRVTAPTDGEIDIYGRIASMLEVGTGFNREMTGRENVYMNGAILGMTRSEISAKMDKIIEFSEIGEFIDTPVKRYSSGMYVKLAFSVAAHLDAEIMIMDEVLAVGDVVFQKKCLDKMREAANRDGRTVLYVSHNMNTIRSLCERCIVLDKGKIVFDGEVDKAIETYLGGREEFSPFCDLTEIERPKTVALKNRDVDFLSIQVLNRTENRVEQGEPFRFLIRMFVHKKPENAMLRFIIYYRDGTVAGASFSDKTFVCIPDNELEITAELPTKNLAPGVYRVDMVAFSSDAFGNRRLLDRVDSAFSFDVVKKEDDTLLWNHAKWGNAQFDDTVITMVQVPSASESAEDVQTL